MDFGLFFFADDGGKEHDRYHLLLEGAKFADLHGFASVWTPERHFHEFGGHYPNPAVTGAAAAAVTSHVEIRAGSVVAPLHHPVRIAEEWSVVDNVSHGRAGISLASGWNLVDFALRPEAYANRKQILVDTVHTLRELWRGESIELLDGMGHRVNVRIFPKPVRPELPLWITSAGSAETFRQAGTLGTGLLTHLLGQTFDELAGKIADYRKAHTAAHETSGHVSLMLHTFLGENRERVRDTVQAPFCDYLRSSMGLMVNAAAELLPGADLNDLDPDDLDFLVENAFERYFETGGLFGTVEDGMTVLTKATEIGVDEIACLIDFIPDTDAVLGGLSYLDQLKNTWAAEAKRLDRRFLH